MAKKQIVRVTESDLHRIIEESVNNILSELDWRTYDAAADQAHHKYMTAPSDQEADVRANQRQKFLQAMKKRQAKQYDGVTNDNYMSQSKFPSTIPNKQVSKDKQLRGASQIARHKRGGDVYDDNAKKWKNID